jgi:C_GCAxxG_C_C family probable redox protein
MSRPDDAVARFMEGYNCSESVFMTYAPQCGVDAATATKIATGLGGGMGRTSQVCGAVSGAMLALSLKYGRTDPKDVASKEAAYAKVRELVAQFRARAGSTSCTELLGCDLGTPEGYNRAMREGTTRKVCPGLVRVAAEVVEGLL